jgi:hypothetical protein
VRTSSEVVKRDCLKSSSLSGFAGSNPASCIARRTLRVQIPFSLRACGGNQGYWVATRSGSSPDFGHTRVSA